MYLQACTVCNYVYVCFVYADATYQCILLVKGILLRGRRTISGASIILAVCYVVLTK